MARKTMDCRIWPSDNNCTVMISGEEDEVLELAAAHAVASHGHTDSPEFREELKTALRDEADLQAGEGNFVQLIEFHTGDLDRFSALSEEWRERIGREATAKWGLVTADRDRPDTYVQIVAFPDVQSAMRNNDHPVTAEFAKRMQEATDGEAHFRNLEVRDVMRM